MAAELPAEQQAIRSRCVHPSGGWRAMSPDAGGRAIHEIIEAHAAATPDRIAVVSPAVALTYRSLNDEANRLARRLVAAAAPADVPVAICCAVGAPQVVAMLAAMKAARFVVALSASAPLSRNRAIVDSMQVGMIVADVAQAAVARALAPRPSSVLDVANVDRAAPADDLELPARADGLVRVALTSGSTGEAKGVMQTHRSTLAGAIGLNNAVHLSPADRLLMGTPGYTTFWRPLLVGAGLYLFDLRADDPAALREWMVDERISALRSTPSVFRQLVAVLAVAGAGGQCAQRSLAPSLRVIECMGEPVPAECLRLLREHFPPSCVLVNCLGAKEVLDYRIHYFDHATCVAERFLPSGFPLGDARVTLLDEAGSALTGGDVGEIAVSSRSMSPGYWRRPDATTARFCRDPADDTRVMYRTGDLGRLMPDGNLVFVGRLDSIVKIRGQRVDPGVVERTLRAIAGIADAAVIAEEGDRQEPRLVAFVVASTAEPPAERELRRRLAGILPDAMIPGTFVFLERMPTTAMGKTDRESLRSLVRPAAPQAASLPLPRTAVEQAVAEICAEVLRRDRVAMEDDFFELGGTSLMVMMVAARLERRLGIAVSVSALFRFPTLRDLARHLAEALEGVKHAPGLGPGDLQRRRFDG